MNEFLGTGNKFPFVWNPGLLCIAFNIFGNSKINFLIVDNPLHKHTTTARGTGATCFAPGRRPCGITRNRECIYFD
jgi:hypothetical protein